MAYRSYGSVLVAWRLYPRHAAWLMGVMIFLACLPLYIHWRLPAPAAHDPVYLAPLAGACITGKVLSYPQHKQLKSTFTLQTESVNDDYVSGQIYVVLRGRLDANLRPGSLVRLIGDLKAIPRTGYGDYLRRRHLFAQLEAMEVSILRAGRDSWWFARLTRAHLGSPDDELRLSLVLGERHTPCRSRRVPSSARPGYRMPSPPAAST